MVTPLNLRADAPGRYFGEAAHFSGDGFSDMNFATDAVSPAAFAQWVAAARAEGPALDGAAYEQLAHQSARVAPFTYRAVAPGLFEAIVTQRLPPGPGPEAEPGGRVVKTGGG
jgi:cytochrome o ubiquinol oxidase subunit 2